MLLRNYRGLAPPSVVYRAFGAYLPDTNNKQFDIKQVMYSVALSGLSFVNALVPGVLPFGQAQAENTPVCGLSRLRRFSPDSNTSVCILEKPLH